MKAEYFKAMWRSDLSYAFCVWIDLIITSCFFLLLCPNTMKLIIHIEHRLSWLMIISTKINLSPTNIVKTEWRKSLRVCLKCHRSMSSIKHLQAMPYLDANLGSFCSFKKMQIDENSTLCLEGTTRYI